MTPPLPRLRSLFVALGAVAYVAFAALEVRAEDALGWSVIAVASALIAFVWRRTEPLSTGPAEVTAQVAARVCVAGAGALLASRLGQEREALTALGNLGAAVASIAALVGLGRVAPMGGMLTAPPRSRRIDTAAFGSLGWTVAIAIPLVSALSPGREVGAWLIDGATTAASLGALGLGLVTTARLYAMRRSELGIADRALAALGLTATSLVVGLITWATGLWPPARALPVAATLAALAQAWAAASQEPTTVARVLRVGLTAMGLAGPFVLGAVYVAHARPGEAAPLVLLAALGAAAGGLAAPSMTRRLWPRTARFDEALRAAARSAMNPDPDLALESALFALRAGVDGADAAPELYRLAPAEVLRVDRTGFIHRRPAELPSSLVELAMGEPERVFRVEAARAVEVRQPSVRPLLAWLDERGIVAAAVVRDDEDPIAVLTLAHGSEVGMSLEEVRSLSRLADRLGAIIGASSMLARSRDRELEGRARIDALEAGTSRLQEQTEREAERHEALARLIARPATVACYSPAARVASEQIERLAAEGRPMTLLTSPGLDAAAWGALVHLGSSRRRGPFIVIDGATAPVSLDFWRDPASSPVHAAADGTLMVLHADRLTEQVQRFLSVAVGEGLALIVGVRATVDALVAADRMSEALASALGDRAIALPELASRSEDLRALALDRLAAIGVELRGAPLGLDLRAQRRLGEHGWPGNDAELRSVLWRAALETRGEVVGERELERSGFRQVARAGRVGAMS